MSNCPRLVRTNSANLGCVPRPSCPQRSSSFTHLKCRPAPRKDGTEWESLSQELANAFLITARISEAHPAAALLSCRDVESLRRELAPCGRWEEGAYTRVKLVAGNGYDVMLLCWSPGSSSPVHGHSDAATEVKSNCFMLILEGELTETQYAWPGGVGRVLGFTSQRKLVCGTTGYINDSIGVHKVANTSAKRAISLHVYAPGWTAAPTYDEPSVDAAGCLIEDTGWGDF